MFCREIDGDNQRQLLATRCLLSPNSLNGLDSGKHGQYCFDHLTQMCDALLKALSPYLQPEESSFDERLVIDPTY
jgi:hypothetical protein